MFVWTTILSLRLAFISWETGLVIPVSIKNILVPDMTVRSVFLFGDEAEGRNGPIQGEKKKRKRGTVILVVIFFLTS